MDHPATVGNPDVNARDEKGHTTQFYSDIVYAAAHCYRETVLLLLSHWAYGANANLADEDSETSFTKAQKMNQ
jgi:hypothetical protein